jgi:hypothetical protein
LGFTTTLFYGKIAFSTEVGVPEGELTSMHYLTNIRARFFGTFLVIGLVNLSSAHSQSMFSLARERPEVPKAELAKKTSFAFKASEFFLAGGTAFDMTTTVMGLEHPTTAYRSDRSFLTRYYVKETGWAGFLGNRDPWTVTAANVILNAGIDRYSRKLYARGGRWRAVGIGALLAKGTLNTIAAGRNVRNDDRIDAQVRLATGYQGRILWSR